MLAVACLCCAPHAGLTRHPSPDQMELDREAQTLRFCIDNKQWISLTGVSTYARPFLNFFNAGDGATLLQAEDGRSIRADLV